MFLLIVPFLIVSMSLLSMEENPGNNAELRLRKLSHEWAKEDEGERLLRKHEKKEKEEEAQRIKMSDFDPSVDCCLYWSCMSGCYIVMTWATAFSLWYKYMA